MSVAAKYVVLLRGVNAGPNNRIAMPELRAALEQAGCRDVRTVAQSGNAVVNYAGKAGDVETLVRHLLTTRFDLDVQVVVRDEDAVRAIVADNPLKHVATDGRRQFIVFCSEPHDPTRLPAVMPPEQLVCRPLELHAWCPQGGSKGRLLPALGRRSPAPITTFRNWNTVVRLHDLLGGRSRVR